MTRFVIVGAGQAGRRAAECLRAAAPDASICVVGEELHLPYDRPSLSKAALLDGEREVHAFIRDEAFYAGERIALRLGVRAISIHRAEKAVDLSDGSKVPYDRLLLATGSRVRTLAGTGVYYLRTLDDARALRQRLLPGTRVAMVGAGFIGLEVAATAITLGCKVTMLEPAERVLKRTMPASISAYVGDMHVRRGVALRLGTEVKGVASHEDGVRIDTNGEALVADLVVAGIGVIPNTELAEAAGLEVNDGIVVDELCRTSDTDIFAAGEVTRHYITALDRVARVESWQVAEKQPAVAAANMLGGSERYGEVPWLWSDQYDCNIQTLGFFDPSLTLVERGRPQDDAFTVLGLDTSGRIRAAATINNGRDMAALTRLLNTDGLDPQRIADPSVSLRSLIRR